MKRFYIDSRALVTQTALADAGAEAHSPVGYFYDQFDQAYTLFVATDAESGVAIRDVNGKVALNVRARSKRPAVTRPEPEPETESE